MRHFLLHLVLNTMALWVVASIYGGVFFRPGSGLADYLAAGLVWGLANALIRPVLLVLTLPINFLTLGLFTFVVNAMVLYLAASFTALEVKGFAGAFVGALILSLVSLALRALFRPAHINQSKY